MSTLDLYVVTFNCARRPIEPQSFASHLFDARPVESGSLRPAPDILVLCLQELAPISHAFLGGSYLTPYYDRFVHAVRLGAAGIGHGHVSYQNVVTRNVGMTALMLFVRRENVEAITSVETAGVGVGLLEMGNKGAVGVRIGYSTGADDAQSVEMTFVAAHLAPMEYGLERRNQDWMNIVRRLVFVPTKPPAARPDRPNPDSDGEESHLLADPTDRETRATTGIYTPTSHLFVAGDLNYRTSVRKPGPSDYESYPQPTGDARDPKHFSHLLQRDQLRQELKAGRTCHGLQEEPIDFPPSYKYSDGRRARADADDLPMWDWAKHRWPSWCDRVLYLDTPAWMRDTFRSASVKVHGYTVLPLQSTSDHRPVAFSCSLPRAPIPAPTSHTRTADPRVQPPFDLDPAWRERRARARVEEVVVGFLSYLALTWEGNCGLLGGICGVLGSWMIVRWLLT